VRRTTLMADDALLLEAERCAKRQGMSLTALFQAALREYLASHATQVDISFAGVGHSGDPQGASRTESVRESVDTTTGWSPRRRKGS
jgi:hypothetical protein